MVHKKTSSAQDTLLMAQKVARKLCRLFLIINFLYLIMTPPPSDRPTRTPPFDGPSFLADRDKNSFKKINIGDVSWTRCVCVLACVLRANA